MEVDEDSMTILDFDKESCCYEVSYLSRGWEKTATDVDPEAFTFPNGTIVKLEGLKEYNGVYGKVVGWGKAKDNSGNRRGVYSVRLSPTVILKVDMDNVRL